MLTLVQGVAAYIHARSLMRAGERVTVAVSGGAESVALLRLLLELRSDLGVVISVAHFHHGIRGADADNDETFVQQLACTYDLEFHVRRTNPREYLRALRQEWREDKTNTDFSSTRNRIRARVLPMLREEVNSSVELALAHLAEVARGEEQYWNDQVTRLLPLLLAPSEPARGGGRKQTGLHGVSVDLEKLRQQPLALQRRLLRAVAEQLGFRMDFEHVE